MLWKCGICGFVHEGAEAPEQCPKCGFPKENYAQLSEEDAKKIYDSDRTNDIHMKIVHLSMQIAALARQGIALNLDPNCVGLFEKAKNEAWTIKQRSKAEIASHLANGKW
ncbi:MAG: rubredoxin-like domain-containing protein [Syntrophomonadaceae bacterium]